MSLEKVDEIEHEPVIGESYLVPCMFRPNYHVDWVPIYGGEHDDKEHFNQPLRHYHYDVRFIHLGHIISLLFLSTNGRSRHMSEEALVERLTVNILSARKDGIVEYREKICYRKMPEIITPKFAKEEFKSLQTEYEHVNISCKTCPHRGFRLNGLPEDEEGNVVCPGHGLKWNVKSGKLVKRI